MHSGGVVCRAVSGAVARGPPDAPVAGRQVLPLAQGVQARARHLPRRRQPDWEVPAAAVRRGARGRTGGPAGTLSSSNLKLKILKFEF